MFAQLRNDASFVQRQKQGEKLSFVDLGSGDGRIVFRAAREKLFHVSIGYELNPLLHLFASLQRIVRGPKAWSTTHFYRRDLWDVDLRNNADVVAVVRDSSLGTVLRSERIQVICCWSVSSPINNSMFLRK